MPQVYMPKRIDSMLLIEALSRWHRENERFMPVGEVARICQQLYEEKEARQLAEYDAYVVSSGAKRPSKR